MAFQYPTPPPQDPPTPVYVPVPVHRVDLMDDVEIAQWLGRKVWRCILGACTFGFFLFLVHSCFG